jgi:gluconate 2-dehydrogenase gamma chain
MAARLMGRRQTLKYIGMLTSTVAGREFLFAWLPKHTEVADSKPWIPLFFKPDEFRAVEALTELIIPTDESAGAKEAQVARYIDFIVSAASEFNSALQLEWMDGLESLERLSRDKYRRSFHELSTGEQEALVKEMSLPEGNVDASHPGYQFYRLVKEMTVEGFYTSRVGLIDVLGYKGLDALREFPGCTHAEHQP